MIFMSKAKRLRVVIKPSFYILDANGQRVQIPGKTIEFNNGRFETDNPDYIAGLLNNDYCNIHYAAVDDEKEWKEQHPEYFKQYSADMITGAVSTINVNKSPLAQAARSHIQPEKKVDPIIDINDIIDKKIDEKFGNLDAKLSKLLSLADEPNVKDSKPKKVFKCPVPGCGFVGKTGMEIGEHKKIAHVV